MNEELSYLDADLKGLFVETKYDDMKKLLDERSDEEVKEIYNHNWGIIKKYYDNENFDLLQKHIKFVAYSCFVIEYAQDRGLIGEDVFGIMMAVFNDIYEIRNKE
ncbi:hypothetical protein [Herbinix luporum]|jgi:hypothetical protein|uniref:Uncharacterized protein n=1 Tax=Herbinix luporum TaxID=1679721 RepID=A0A0K8J4A1_9FIRM|nr:hypothetical protein [Herbinix luporum]CUH92312.1 hypothetical protein SD1D_0764 [Herbinix luporum]